MTSLTSSGPRLATRPVAYAIALILAVTLLLAAGAERAHAAKVTCPSTFRVLHNDTIGKLKLAKGHYKVTVKNDNRLSCAAAFDLFRQFLEDYDGKLSDGWRIRARRQEFFQPRTNDAFSVKATTRPSGGGGGGGRHPTGNACPNLFTVQNNDRIGRLRLPAGQYRITLLAHNRLSCQRASKLFAKFLQDYTGRLQNRWRLDVETATFSKRRNFGFRVKQVR